MSAFPATDRLPLAVLAVLTGIEGIAWTAAPFIIGVAPDLLSDCRPVLSEVTPDRTEGLMFLETSGYHQTILIGQKFRHSGSFLMTARGL